MTSEGDDRKGIYVFVTEPPHAKEEHFELAGDPGQYLARNIGRERGTEPWAPIAGRVSCVGCLRTNVSLEYDLATGQSV